MNLDPEIQKLIEKENRKWKEMSDKKLEADFNNAMAQIEKDFTERTEIINTHPVNELDDALEKHSVYSKLFDEAETMNINGTMPQRHVYGQKQERYMTDSEIIKQQQNRERNQRRKKAKPEIGDYANDSELFANEAESFGFRDRKQERINKLNSDEAYQQKLQNRDARLQRRAEKRHNIIKQSNELQDKWNKISGQFGHNDAKYLFDNFDNDFINKVVKQIDTGNTENIDWINNKILDKDGHYGYKMSPEGYADMQAIAREAQYVVEPNAPKMDKQRQQKKKNTPAVKTSEEILSDKNSVKVIDKLKAQGFTEKQAISLIAENGADDAMAVAKSVHRHKAKSNADIKYARRMPENFEKHMGLITSDMTLKEKIAMKHLEKKDLIDNARDSVAKARMAYDKPVPEKLKKQIIKEANPNSTIASVAKGNKWTIANGAFAGIMGIADYKESRKEGKTVLESAGSAVFEFAKGEVLGFWGSVGLDIVKGVPKMAVGAYNEVQSVNRSMNNLQRFTPFADSQFADTQQLATMRQSGMEMAKMANYNLQQTLMGTEAKYLHR